MTFSIVAHSLGNPDTGDSADSDEWGIAVASKFLAAGAVVPWARAGVGAIATQALANVAYGPEGLARLAAGGDAGEVVATLTGEDADRAHRQLGVVDRSGRAATYTGSSCLEWAGGVSGPGFACQGNILTGPEVIDAMVEAFRSESGDLAGRLLAALGAGDRAGGDRRGRQSAALLVVREGGGYGGGVDIAVDLRVDDHPQPVEELGRLLGIHRLLMPRPEDLEFVPFDDGLEAAVAAALTGAGYDVSAGLRPALSAYVGTENLEERWTDDPSVVEAGILRHLGI